MFRKLSFAASRQNGKRLFRWSIVALIGIVGGGLLGEMVAAPLAGLRGGGAYSFSSLSANPNASVVDGQSGLPLPCPECPDSYGVAAKLRSDREQRMSDEFRELGAVAVDPPPTTDIDDGYRYGGRFPDPPQPAFRTEPAPEPSGPGAAERESPFLADAADPPIL